MADKDQQLRTGDQFPASGRSSRGEERLVTVESQREFDLFTGEWAERVFVKLYVAARTSGLLAAISDRDWKTLCTLATYMDGKGYCYPSQAELAAVMGCSRQMANERIRSLADFRFQGNPVLMIVKGDRVNGGKWSGNGYRVLSLSNLKIYDDSDLLKTSPIPANDSSADTSGAKARTVSRKLDTVGNSEATVSSPTVTVELDTNKNHYSELDIDHSNIRNVTDEIVDKSGAASGTDKEVATSNDGQRAVAGRVIAGNKRRKAVIRGGTAGMTSLGELAQLRQQPQTEIEETRREVPGRGGTRQRRHVVQQDESYQVILSYMADFSRELNDRAPLPISTKRAYNLYKRSGLELGAFVQQLYAARAIVKERTGSIQKRGDDSAAGPMRHKAPYYFAVLEDLLGLREGHPPGEQPKPRSTGS